LNVVLTRHVIQPFRSTVSVKSGGFFFEVFFKFIIVFFKIFLSEPLNLLTTLRPLNIGKLVESHVEILLNGFLDQILVGDIIVSILFDLIKDTVPEHLLVLFENKVTIYEK